jgi:hypothetical protein
MATMTREESVTALKAAFELADLTETLRIETGIRDPEAWSQKKRAVCQGRHAGAFCRGCYQKIEAGAPMVWQEDRNCYSQSRRHRYWHLDCHPDWINREFDRIRRLWEHRTTCP